MPKLLTNGSFVDADGTAVANGTLVLTISQDAQIIAGGNVQSRDPVIITLDILGDVTGSPSVYGQDELSPGNTYYTAEVLNSGGSSVWGPTKWVISGASPINLDLMVPTLLNPDPAYSEPVLKNPTGNQTITTGNLTMALGDILPAAGNTTQALGSAAAPWDIYGNLVVANGILFADQFPGGNFGDKVTAAIAALPSAGGTIDARGLAGTQSAPSTITINKPVNLYLPSGTITLAGAPGMIVTAAGTFINGGGESATILSCSSAATDCISWRAPRGVLQNLTVTTPTNTTNGVVLDAPAAGQDVKFVNLKNLSITAPSTSTADGLKFLASDPTHKVSFVHTENVEIIDYLNGQHMATSGTVGPTDNVTIGGQFRQTVLRGTGILIDAAAADNVWVGGNISFYTTAISLVASATVTDNRFYGIVPESNTAALTVGAGATDNQFYGVPFGSQTFTDAGTRTVVQHGNNTLGPGGSTAQKQGAPFFNLTLMSTAGQPVTLTSSSGASTSGSPSLGVATVDLTAQTAAVGTTTLYAVPASLAGQYRLSWDAKVTTAAGTSSTLGALTIVYTDPDGVAQTITAPASIAAGTIATTSAGNTTTTVLLGVPLLLNCKASTNITYAFAYASNAANAMNYNLHLKLEAL